ncbi:MAG: uroporphyrinogen-III C-methyltransferase [Paenibacillaceae bacterium]|nr:uroporphyrinogen-III C-methyltransferase [Paenibacillaceae bacterium]
MRPGWVAFVGAGPGDASLITVRGRQLLREADVVVYDRLAGSHVLSFAKTGARRIYCGKEPHVHTMKQAEINACLISEAQRGHFVVRLKGGDPSVFGRVGEEAQACRAAGVPYVIVPGVSAAMAAGAYAGIPLTHRDYNASFAVVTGNRCHPHGPIDWAAYAHVETLVIYMGLAAMESIANALMQSGKRPDTPVALIHAAATPMQHTTVAQLATAAEVAVHVRAPAIIVIGDIVRLRAHLAWAEQLPLHGQTVVQLCDDDRFADDWFADDPLPEAAFLGAAVTVRPLLRACALPDEPTCVSRLLEAQCIVFASGYAVDAAIRLLVAHDIDIRRLRAAVCAEEETARVRLAHYGLRATKTEGQTVKTEGQTVKATEQTLTVHHGEAHAHAIVLGALHEYWRTPTAETVWIEHSWQEAVFAQLPAAVRPRTIGAYAFDAAL